MRASRTHHRHQRWCQFGQVLGLLSLGDVLHLCQHKFDRPEHNGAIVVLQSGDHAVQDLCSLRRRGRYRNVLFELMPGRLCNRRKTPWVAQARVAHRKATRMTRLSDVGWFVPHEAVADRNLAPFRGPFVED